MDLRHEPAVLWTSPGERVTRREREIQMSVSQMVVAEVAGVGTLYTVFADGNGTFSLSVQSGGSGRIDLKCGMSFRTAMTDCIELVCAEMAAEVS